MEFRFPVPGKPRFVILPAAAAVFAVAIFVADSVTHAEIAVAPLYTAVVLLVIRFLKPRGVLLVAVGCMLLATASALLHDQGELSVVAFVNLLAGLAAIGITTYLALSDITARKQAQEVLQRTQSELAHVTRVTTLGELVASIAHEVNQPLAAIVANGEASVRWLDHQSPRLDEVRDALERIVSEGVRASEVVKRLRRLSAKGDAQMVPLDINEVINEAILLVQREALDRNVSVQLEANSRLPAVLGDRVQLQQVIINLVMNAIEAMTAVTGRPCTVLIQVYRNEDGDVVVAVQDSGSGIGPEEANRLFKPFFTTKAHGMGMGLSICRSIIERHEGRIWASQNAGPGATLQFALPTCREDAS